MRTVPVNTLGAAVLGIAEQDELGSVVAVIYRLMSAGESVSPAGCSRGNVWSGDFSNTATDDALDLVNVLVVHYNAGNGMAMTMIVTDAPRNPGGLVLPVTSNPALLGHSLLVSHVRSLDFAERFIRRVGSISEQEVDFAARQFVGLIS